MMLRVALYLAGIVIIGHGLIHLMGLVAYWPLATLAELPYKTALLGGHWEVGRAGMRLYATLWLVGALAFVVATAGLLLGRAWWYPALWFAVLLSLVVIAFDLGPAYRGAILDGLLLIWLLLALGLRILPSPFPGYPVQGGTAVTLPLPAGLPAPVERYYRMTFGDRVPQIDSVVMTGTADLRFGGITFPARWRFVHQAGQGYRHYIEATYFGRPLLKVNEHFLDGQIRMALPVGVVENDPKSDEAAFLSLWGEGLFFPSLFLTDPRARWEPIDGDHARLVIPSGVGEDAFMVTFDGQSGLLQSMDAMRWKAPDSQAKTGWHLEPLAWGRLDGALLPTAFGVTWADESGPWLKGTVQEIIYNVDVQAYIKASGL